MLAGERVDVPQRSGRRLCLRLPVPLPVPLPLRPRLPRAAPRAVVRGAPPVAVADRLVVGFVPPRRDLVLPHPVDHQPPRHLLNALVPRQVHVRPLHPRLARVPPQRQPRQVVDHFVVREDAAALAAPALVLRTGLTRPE